MDPSKNDTVIHHAEQPGPRRRSSVIEAPALPNNTLATSDDLLRKLSIAIPDLENVTNAAKAATETEHQMGVLEAATLYPKAIIYSMG